MNVEVLENDTWHLRVSPDHGASVAALRGRVGGAWAPVMRETPEEALASGQPSRFSSFTLAPYSNRIRGARFVFEGKTFDLRPTTREGNAQHGDVRGRPWRARRTSPESLDCAIDSRDFGDMNFPFPFTMRATYSLQADVLIMQLALVNVGASRMPAGFGLHPYFVRRLGPAEDVALGFHAEGVYLAAGEDPIPDGAMVPVPTELDFSKPSIIGDRKLDHVFGGWDGRASLAWRGAGVRLDVECDPVFTHIVAYTAPDGTLAVEPVTHATDGFNLLARGVPGTGVRVLEPGEVMEGAVRLRLVTSE